jgi:hypothetical protein
MFELGGIPMGHVLESHSADLEAVRDPALVYRLEVPGAFGPIEFQAASQALSFAKVAFPALAGQGLKARVWIGKRIGACEIWPIAPHMISV